MPFQVGSEDSPKAAERYIDLLGGINSNDKSWDIADFQLQWAENCQYRKGILQRRFGTEQHSDIGVNTISRVDWAYGTTYVAYDDVNDDLYTNSGGQTWTLVAGVTASSTGQVGVERYGGFLTYPSLHLSGSTTSPLLLDISDMSVGFISAGNWDYSKNFRWAKKYKSWLFLGGASEAPAQVFHCAVDDITLWNALEHYKLDPSDGGTVANAVVVNDKLYLFKDTSVWRIFGDNPDVWVQKHVSDEYGLTLGGATSVTGTATTLQAFNEGAIFVNRDGRVIFYDGGEFIDVGKNIQNIIEDWLSGTDTKSIKWSTMVWNKKYYLTCENATKDNYDAQVLVLDADGKEPVWMQHTYYAPTTASQTYKINNFLADTINNKAYFVDNQGIFTEMEVQDVYTDRYVDNTLKPIRMQFTTKDFDLFSLEGLKRFKNVRIFRGDFKAPLYIHPRMNLEEQEDILLNPSQDPFRSDRIPLRGRGRFLGFRFDSTGNKASEFYGFTPIWKPKKVR